MGQRTELTEHFELELWPSLITTLNAGTLHLDNITDYLLYKTGR